MKFILAFLSVVFSVVGSSLCFAGSLLDNDPEVVFFEANDEMILLVVKEATVFATKKGGSNLGTYPVDTKLRLLGMTDKGYKVKGKAKHSLVTGWVSPKNLASKQPKFVEELKQYYERELAIRELIANKEVAIGMTIDEVEQSVGQPTKKESRITKDGRTGKWEFIKGKEQKHYTNTVDPRTGQVFRRFSHVTIEEQEKLTIEFENNVVTAISSLKNNSAGNIRIIVPPIIFGF
ncbi:hypothetical protein [Rubritalea profundi]|uniref:SH3b domain-containing protein n=1 Tax=Rubritalea profundi TaxID=1658618 RepID=A0A2S7U1P3_9BACT|nr:hypothetical protein [Rubritalea profundi]PQJ28926.1 hypothetical protein BSZ32_10790 [Rubritalea profundi]